MTTATEDGAGADVETTNWNAVKLLATKYGIQLRSLEEIQASRHAIASMSPQEREEQGMERGDSEEDLGVGTPFMITARTMEGGRVVYRFKWREGDGTGLGQSSCSRGEVDEGTEAGYDPGSDSPSSSFGRSAGKRRQTSSRTLKTKRSIPVLRNVSAIGSSSTQSDRKRVYPDAKEVRPTPPKVQRGDVLGAILGLREGITAQDYSWIEAGRDSQGRAKDRNSKGKSAAPVAHFLPSGRPRRPEPAWRSISPFGEPVLQKDRGHMTAPSGDWTRSPIPRMTDFGQPLFPDSGLSASTPPSTAAPIEVKYTDDKGSDGMFVFDVLQRYTHRGMVPMDDDMFASPSPTPSPARTRQASSSSDAACSSPMTGSDHLQAESSISAVPGDDPRFALWAIRSSDDDDALVLSSRNGIVDVVPPSPTSAFTGPAPGSPRTPASGKRWSVRGSVSTLSSNDRGTSSPAGSAPIQESKHSMLFPSDGAFLIAASTPCLIAELTSRIDNRLMTDFFYTYRAYLSSQDLLRLLAMRFKWAMAKPTSPKDEGRRKIVRVRTYVVLKYWLSNFFEVDFLPNRPLRRQLTDWLNSMSIDEDLPDQGIVKSLKKIVRGLKKAYEQAGVGGILFADTADSPERGTTERGPDTAVSLEWDDYDSDEEHYSPSAQTKSPLVSGFGVNARDGFSSIVDPWRPAAGTGNTGSPAILTHNPPPPLPVSQNALSRVFVNTVGKLSRFKRNLNTRTGAGLHSGGASENSGFDGLEFEANESGDLLFIRGGVENFINFFHLSGNLDDRGQPASEEDPTSDSTTALEGTPSLSAASNQSRSTPASSLDLSNSVRNDKIGSEYGLGISHEEPESNPDQLYDEVTPTDLTKANLAKSVDHLHHFQSDQTLRSVSTAQQSTTLDACPSPSPAKATIDQGTDRRSSQKGPDNIVQIDDIDLSSGEDDGIVRRALRRLPGARDLRMANHVQDLGLPVRSSLDSVSVASFGRVYSASHHSLTSYYRRGSNGHGLDDPHRLAPTRPESPRRIGTVQSEMLDPDEALRGYELVKGFRLDQLDSDDEEPGDVEAALRRLEGFIDQDKQKEKQRRVEAMWLRSQAQRQLEEDEMRNNENRTPNRNSAPSIQQQSIVERGEGSVCRSQRSEKADNASAPSVTPVKSAKVRKRPVTQGGMLAPAPHRPTAASSESARARARRAEGGTPALPSQLWAPPAPVHRSFLLNYRSEVIAQQFSLIESELFKAVTWQELVSEQWKTKHYPGQVLDWESFYQATVRRRAEAQKSQHSTPGSNVEAIIARFNLTCNWVASEVVLTRHVEDRAAVICKLIRIAWKCYHHSNFATLTQIILGLQSPWLERLTKTWSRVGMLEMRMLRDLKAFINPARNFKHLRSSMRDMVVQGGMEDLVTSSGPPRSGNKGRKPRVHLNDGCIPFFGLFLSDLAVNDTLPTLIEPSSPNSAVDYDPTTGHLRSLADPRAFAHLAPLPDGMPLSPLVNMYKYRIIALTVKSVLAFQERLDAYEFQADASVYVKALRIRCLEGEQLTQISHLVEP